MLPILYFMPVFWTTCMSIIHVCLGGTTHANTHSRRPEDNLKGQPLPPKAGSLATPSCVSELTHSQASGNFPIIASHPSHCRQAGTADTLTEQLLYPQNHLPSNPWPFTASLLPMKPSLKLQPSKLQSHMPIEGAYHWWASNTIPVEPLCPALPDTLVCCSDGIWNLAPSVTFFKKQNHFLFDTQLLFKFPTLPAGAEGASPLLWLPAKHAEAGNGAGGQRGGSWRPKGLFFHYVMH